MKALIKLFVVLLGLAFIAGGLYLGIGVMLIGGIVHAVEIVQSGVVVGKDVALTVVRILLFELPIAFGFYFGFIIMAVAGMSSSRRRFR